MGRKDAWRAYYELALGLTETSRKKAAKIVKDVAGKGGGTAEQLQELVNTAVANREAVSRMVKVEIDRALSRVGLATMDEVEALTRRVRELERELADTRAGREAAGATTASASVVGAAAGTPSAAETAAADRAAAQTEAARRSTVETATKTAAKKTVAKKAVAKKAVAKKAVATKTAAPETTPTPMTSAGAPTKAPVKKTTKKTAAAKKASAKKVTPTKSMKPAKASVTRQSVADGNR